MAYYQNALWAIAIVLLLNLKQAKPTHWASRGYGLGSEVCGKHKNETFFCPPSHYCDFVNDKKGYRCVYWTASDEVTKCGQKDTLTELSNSIITSLNGTAYKCAELSNMEKMGPLLDERLAQISVPTCSLSTTLDPTIVNCVAEFIPQAAPLVLLNDLRDCGQAFETSSQCVDEWERYWQTLKAQKASNASAPPPATPDCEYGTMISCLVNILPRKYAKVMSCITDVITNNEFLGCLAERANYARYKMMAEDIDLRHLPTRRSAVNAHILERSKWMNIPTSELP